jgi:glycosyltransferase involved in cell wall biosynthesis
VAYDVFSKLNEKLALKIVSLHGGPMMSQFSRIANVSILPPSSFMDYLRTDGLRACLPAFIGRPLTRGRIRSHKPDLIYVNGAIPLSSLNQLGLDDVPVILHAHEMDSYLRQICRDYHNILVNRPDRYIAVSNATKDSLVKFGVDAERISMIYNSLPRQVILAPAEPIHKDDIFVIGGCGDSSWAKGTQLWLQMAVEVIRTVGEDTVRFVWLGIDESRASSEFMETARKLKIHHLIDFLPATPEPFNVFNTFDILAVSSWEETFSLAALECMALGKVVVCFADNGGTPEVIGDTGICVPDFSPQLMAQSIVELINSPKRMEALGAAAHERATTQFQLDAQVESIYNIITQVCRKGSK